MTTYIGKLFANYQLLELLGKGSFAEVYLGKHCYLNSYAAIKVLHHSLLDKQEARFLAEAQILARLTHPHIVRILQYTIEEGTPVLVTDYAPGGSLRQNHPEGSRLEVSQAVEYIQQIAKALQYAHNHQMVHRDVKPENILFGEEGQLLLGDFGLALFAPSSDLLSKQEMEGTLSYMAPEQLRGKPSFASDQYALGIITYELLCGNRPFTGTYWQIIQQHLFTEPPSLREQRPELSPAVETVVLRALSKEVQQRYASVQNFARALERAYHESMSPVVDDAEVTASFPALSRSLFIRKATPSYIETRPTHPLPRPFIIASAADTNYILQLKQTLHESGVVYGDKQARDRESLHLQSDALRQAIRESTVVLVVVSPEMHTSRLVEEQLRIARMYQRRMIFVWVEGEEVASMLVESWGETPSVEIVDARGERYGTALGELVELLKGSTQIIPDQDRQFPAPTGELRNPYKGLRAFTCADATDFYGRDTLIEEMLETVQTLCNRETAHGKAARLLAVMGPSGSGKSSVVQAGLLPRLQQSTSLGSRDWLYLDPFVPGQHPLEGLALTLAPHLPQRSLRSIVEDLQGDSARGLHLLATQLVKQQSRQVVLVVDQFEEVFTLVANEAERKCFIDLLVTALSEPSGPVIVILTLRADFYDRLVYYPALAQVVQAHHLLVLPMDLHDLRSVIESPALLPDVQLRFEGNLVGDLLFEAQGQVGALPLLEFTLDQLFHLRAGHMLTEEAYQYIGGVKGALTRHAEETYATLPSDQHRKMAQALFLRLIDPGMTEQDTTRRRTTLWELSLPDAKQTAMLQQTADAFVAARLLVTNTIDDTTTIEVSHEALIREWSRLANWLREKREDVQLQQTISNDVADWLRHERAEDRLYRGTQLADALAWAQRNVPSQDEVAFLQAGTVKQEQQRQVERAQQARELTLQRRVVSRQRLLVSALSVFSIIVLVLATIAEIGRLQENTLRIAAVTQAQIARSRQLSAQANYAIANHQEDQALLLSELAEQTANTFDARDSLLTALQSSPYLAKILAPGFSSLDNTMRDMPLGFEPGKKDIVSMPLGRIAMVWDTRTWRVRSLNPDSDFQDASSIGGGLVISPDTHLFASNGPNGLWLWNRDTGKTTQLPENSITQYQERHVVVFSPDGTMLATADCTLDPQTHCIQAQILLWKNLASPHPESEIFLTQKSLPIGMTFSPDGKSLAVSNEDKTVQLWDIASKGLIGQFSDDRMPDFARHIYSQEMNIAFSPDRKTLAVVDGTGSIHLWDVASQQLLTTLFGGHEGVIQHVAFSPDGKLLASIGSDDKTIRIWNVTAFPDSHRKTVYRYTSPRLLVGHTQSIVGFAFSQESTSLISIDQKGATFLWNLQQSSSVSQELTYNDPSNILCILPGADGKSLITGNDQGQVNLWQKTSGTLLTTFDTTRFGYPPTNLPGEKNPPNNEEFLESLALSPDGKILAAGRLDGLITLWDMSTRRSLAHFWLHRGLNTLTFSHDGRRLASGYNDGTILLSQSKTGQILHTFSHSVRNIAGMAGTAGSTFTMDFSWDNALLAAGDHHTMLLWDVQTGKRLATSFVGDTSDISGVAFSPDKQKVASIDATSTVMLWNLHTGKLLHALPENSSIAHPTPITGLSFSPNGKSLVMGSLNMNDTTAPVERPISITVWDISSATPLAHAFTALAQPPGSVQFTPDGQQVLSLANSDPNNFVNYVMMWNVNVSSWQKNACSIANRNFTIAEWRHFAQGEPYRQVCPDLSEQAPMQAL